MDSGDISIILFLAGAALIGLEFFIPGGIAGVIGASFMAGAVVTLIFPGNFWVVFFAGFAVTCIVSTLALMYAYRHFRRPRSEEVMASGRLAGQDGVVLETVSPNSMSGKVRVAGDVWSAESDEELLPGTEVSVTRVEGVRAIVVRKVD